MAVEKVLYTAKIRTQGGREGGTTRSDDGRIDLKISPPGTGTGTNPEQLFAAGWSTCYLSALKLLAGKKKIALSSDTTIDSEVDLAMAGGGYVLQVRMKVSMPGVDRAIAQQLIEEGHRTCPYSKATKGNIDVTTTLVGETEGTSAAALGM